MSAKRIMSDDFRSAIKDYRVVSNPFMSSWTSLLDSSSRSAMALAFDSWSIYKRMAQHQTTEWLSWTRLGIEQSRRALAVWENMTQHCALDAKPRIALIAGADCAEGQALVGELAEAGYRVLCTYGSDIDPRRVTNNFNYPVRWLFCDLSDVDACFNLNQRIVHDYGRVDIVVNCVSGGVRMGCVDEVETTPDTAMHSVLATALDRTFNVTRGFLNGMIARRFGRLISILPTDALPGSAAIDAPARAAVLAFTRSLAAEVVDDGVTVNCISLQPATQITPQLSDLVRQFGETGPREIGNDQRLAAAVLSLASDSNSVSGTNVLIASPTLM